LGDCRREGWKYSRAFEHATASVDLETREAAIDWDTGGLSD
jgi:hypothetical protein